MEKTLQEQVLDALDTYIDMEGTILEEYMAGDDGMLTELAAAEANFRKAIEKLIPDEEDFNDKRLIESVRHALQDCVIEEDDLAVMLDIDTIISHAASLGYVCVKIENLADQMKLDDFICTELYPHLNDQEVKLFV